jgi:hypothetical protein
MYTERRAFYRRGSGGAKSILRFSGFRVPQRSLLKRSEKGASENSG